MDIHLTSRVERLEQRVFNLEQKEIDRLKQQWTVNKGPARSIHDDPLSDNLLYWSEFLQRGSDEDEIESVSTLLRESADRARAMECELIERGRVLAEGVQMWVVGQRLQRHKSEWEFQGVFSTKQKAIDACKKDLYFVAPACVDEPFPDQSIEWPGAWYPRLQPEPVDQPATDPAEDDVVNDEDVGEGYRLLKRGEVIQKGDDYWCINQWRPSHDTGKHYGFDNLKRRRRDLPTDPPSPEAVPDSKSCYALQASNVWVCRIGWFVRRHWHAMNLIAWAHRFDDDKAPPEYLKEKGNLLIEELQRNKAPITRPATSEPLCGSDDCDDRGECNA